MLMLATKNKLRTAAFAAAFVILPLLQGCFPVIAGGVAGGVLVATDRRTSGTYLEDEGIEVKANKRIKEKFGDTVYVNVTSYNRTVLLTGEAPSDAVKAEAEQIAGAVPNVKAVVNELQIAGISSLAARGNDSYLTSKVKGRFVGAEKFSANHVKVVTEGGVVYLLGLVTRQEADDAVEIARTTSGVNRVVKVFEYVTLTPN